MEEIRHFLQKINCEEFTQVFENNNITVDCLPTLVKENEILKELLPVIGDRLSFIKKYNEYKVLQDSVILTMQPDGTLLNIEQASRSVQSPDALETSSNSSNTSDELVVPVSEHRTISFRSSETTLLSNQMPEFNLLELLRKAPMGKKITTYYDEHNILSSSMRNRLVDIIFTELFDFHCKHRLTHKDYEVILKKIHMLFPLEPLRVYYTAAVRKEVAGKCVLAKGKLLHKAKNLIHLGGYSRPTKKRKHENEVDNDESAKNIELDLSSNDSYIWLLSNREPWDDVSNHWRNTIDLRKSCNVPTVAEYLEQWPVLKDPRSYSLIDYDFEQKFPGQGLNLTKNWEGFFKKIINVKGETIENISNLDELDKNSRITKQILSLGQILPPKGRAIKEKKHWKFSTQECVDSVIVHVNNAADIDESINLHKEKAKAQQLTLQPFLLVEGTTTNEIKNIYVVVDEIRYQFNDALRAFDILFKIFFAFNINFPVQAEHIYELIEVGIFKSDRKDLKYIHHFEDILSQQPSN